MAQPRPSELLQSLSAQLPSNIFVNLLSEHLYPSIDRLPDAQRSNIVRVLEALQENHSKLVDWSGVIDYPGMNIRLRDQIKALDATVRIGYDEDCQDEMEKIATDIAEWLSTLWTIGVEKGAEIELIHECLMLCKTTIEQVRNCGSRLDFNECEIDVMVGDSSHTIVYSGNSLLPAIAWVWRELLLSALAKDEDEDIDATWMIDELERYRYLSDVEEQLRDQDETDSENGSYHDSHWSESMRNAATQLKKLIAARRIKKRKLQ